MQGSSHLSLVFSRTVSASVGVLRAAATLWLMTGPALGLGTSWGPAEHSLAHTPNLPTFLEKC